MEIKLLLLKAISAVYYSSHSSKPDPEGLNNLLDRSMAHLNLVDDPNQSNRDSSALMKLRSLLIWMKTRGAGQPYELADLMARVRVAVGDNDRLYDLFCTTLLLIDDPDAAQDKLNEIAAELYLFIASEEFTTLLRKSAHKLGFNRPEDLAKYRDELVLKLQDLSLAGRRRATSMARCIDLTDAESLADVYTMAQTAIDPRAILKLPFKAANRLRGDQGGARRGEWANVSALSGMNKSGDLLDTFISMCIFNSPVLFDETKKPLHIYTTIEDKLELVLQKLYVLLMQHEFNLPVIIKGINPQEMADYVIEKLTANGWHVKFAELPGGTPAADYVQMLRDLQDDGYEIVSAGCDYVNLLGKQGIPAQVAGDEVQGCHRLVRSFTSPNNIYHYTAHQLSTQAKELSRMYPDEYIRKLPGKGYYEGCKKLDTEFDFEHFVAKTTHGGITWQEVQWGKHRKMGATAEEDKYYCLKFRPLPMIGFQYDVHLDTDLSYKKVGSHATNGEGGSDWRDFE